jgi:hypothetical protein
MANSTFGMGIAMLMLGWATCAQGQNAPCALDDVRVTELKATNFGQSATRVVGRLVNGCNVATGAEVRLVFRRADGAQVYAEEVWPASISDVNAREEFPFEITVQRVPAFDRIEATVIRLKSWAPSR